MTSFVKILYVILWIATAGKLGFLFAATTTTTSVSFGYYVMDIFSDPFCTIAASQQAFQLNACYLSSSTGYYEVSVLKLVTTTNVFSSFVVYSSTTLTACKAYITSISFAPNAGSDLGEGNCLNIGSTSFYYQSWFSVITPSGLMYNNTINLGSASNGLIVQEYDNGCTTTTTTTTTSNPRINAFFASTSTCVPFPAKGTSTSSYVTARCTGYGPNGVSFNVYSTNACSDTPILKQFTAGTTCQSSLQVVAVESPAALYTCVKFSYASAGYASTLVYADSGCAGNVISATESTLNQCFPAMGTNAGTPVRYIASIVQYNPNDLNPLRGFNTLPLVTNTNTGYTSTNDCQAALVKTIPTTTTPSSTVYASACQPLVSINTGLVIPGYYIKSIIGSTSQVPTNLAIAAYQTTEYPTSSCTATQATGSSYYFKTGACLPFSDGSAFVGITCTRTGTSQSATISYYLNASCSNSVKIGQTIAPTTGTCTPGIGTFQSPAGDAPYQITTCLNPYPTGQPSSSPTSRPSHPTFGPTFFPKAPTPSPTNQVLVQVGVIQQVLGLPSFSATTPVDSTFSTAIIKSIFNGLSLYNFGGSVTIQSITYGSNRRQLLLQPVITVQYTVIAPNSGLTYGSLQTQLMALVTAGGITNAIRQISPAYATADANSRPPVLTNLSPTSSPTPTPTASPTVKTWSKLTFPQLIAVIVCSIIGGLMIIGVVLYLVLPKKSSTGTKTNNETDGEGTGLGLGESKGEEVSPPYM